MNQPLDHVLRAKLPWRDEQLTECGRMANDVGASITLGQLKVRIRDWGKQRTSFTVCMTCWNSAVNSARWDTDPVGVVQRECTRAGSFHPNYPKAEHIRMANELRAIEALIKAHPEEFYGYMEGIGQTTNLADRRKTR